MRKWILLALLLHLPNIQADEGQAQLADAFQEYLDFADYGDGVIPPAILDQQINQVWVIDTRRPADYEKGHLPGAKHIEWRQIIEHLDALPKDQKIVVYCDTGVLSSKAHLMLRLLGYENSRVLLGGYQQWQAYQQEKKNGH